MHTIRFKLETTAYDEQVIKKRFYTLSHIHNVMVKHTKKFLKRIKFHKEYQERKKPYAALGKKQELSADEKKQKRQLSAAMKEIRSNIGLSEQAFQAYLKVCGRPFSKFC